ncbi:G patch domain and ankyrin repeat-containing protein 1 isoform X2 [Poeciliopsis prolifica]|uniref:G patch domain and ankyrin repeat-containing protein 1 isoform X2 n=1 Tax=Poeciliopsis prolifica TaxID=188132 RepID=UPI00072CE475|nr:G patch domain and ankyrin repeat-containing protein 1 isoform X2 [Poeciliopsis prolifica]
MAALGFIPANDQDAFSFGTEQTSTNKSSKISGEEVRRFYEDLIKDDKTQKDQSVTATHRNNPNRGSDRRMRRQIRAGRVQQVRPESMVQMEARPEREDNQRRQYERSERAQELQGLRLLRCAHQGDIAGLKELISKGVDINFQDSYLWTAVMCASWSGQKAAVRLLLMHGAAWVGVVDTRGKDAQDLASEAGHDGVLEELLSFGKSPQRETSSLCSLLQPQWCDVCHSEYEGSHSSHISSTLHQFSLGRPEPTPYYCLPSSSNSYRMMVRCGWKPGTGLGPEADGTKQPVSTVLKRDQKGLGFGPIKRPKVTHFKAGDADAVKNQYQEKEEKGKRGQKKDEIKRKEQKDKNWERDFRAMFYQ